MLGRLWSFGFGEDKEEDGRDEVGLFEVYEEEEEECEGGLEMGDVGLIFYERKNLEVGWLYWWRGRGGRRRWFLGREKEIGC